MPFTDKAGQSINSETDWHHSRNQQRNWETLIQVISLRTQPLEITRPVKVDNAWEFEFTADNPGVFSVVDNPDPVAGLRQDFEGIPMLVNLNETSGLVSSLITQGSDQNIWLDAVNNALD